MVGGQLPEQGRNDARWADDAVPEGPRSRPPLRAAFTPSARDPADAGRPLIGGLL